jgi:galactokinase
MVGGGFGGSAIALVAQAQIEEIKGAIADAFTSASFTQPRFFTSLPSAGAQIVKKQDR